MNARTYDHVIASRPERSRRSLAAQSKEGEAISKKDLPGNLIGDCFVGLRPPRNTAPAVGAGVTE